MSAASNSGRARHRGVLLAAGAVLLLVLGFGIFLALRPAPADRLVWMTPPQFARASNPGPFARLKYQIRNLLGPALKYLRPLRPNIITRVNLIGLNNEAAQLASPQKPPWATNAEGFRVWELSEAEFKKAKQLLKTMGKPTTESTMVAASGGRAHMALFDTPPPGASYGPVGLNCDVTTRYANGVVKILLGLTWTEKPSATAGASNNSQTNLALAFRASIANAGALLIQRRTSGNPGGTNYWFLVSTTAVDARGNPLRN